MATIAEQLTSLANTKAAIKDAIVAKGVQVTDDVPFSGYPTKIGEISGGGAPTTKYGMTIDNIFGDEDETYGLQNSTWLFTADFTGVKKIGHNGLSYKFAVSGTYYGVYVEKILMPDVVAVESQGCHYLAKGTYQLKEVDISSLTVISTPGAFTDAFNGCGQLTVVKMDKVTTISGSSSCQNMFYGAVSLSQFPLENLVSISGVQSCDGMFTNTAFETVTFRNLVSITGTDPVRSMFTSAKVKKAYFPMLTELDSNVFRSSRQIFASCTALEEIHFRADMQAAVEAQPGYASKLGATNATIYFDL